MRHVSRDKRRSGYLRELAPSAAALARCSTDCDTRTIAAASLMDKFFVRSRISFGYTRYGTPQTLAGSPRSREASTDPFSNSGALELRVGREDVHLELTRARRRIMALVL